MTIANVQKSDDVGALSVESALVLSKLQGLQSEVSHIFHSLEDQNQKEMIEEILNSEELAVELKAESQIYSNNMDSLTEASRQIVGRLREIFLEKQRLVESVKNKEEHQKVVAANLADELDSLGEDIQMNV